MDKKFQIYIDDTAILTAIEAVENQDSFCEGYSETSCPNMDDSGHANLCSCDVKKKQFLQSAIAQRIPFYESYTDVKVMLCKHYKLSFDLIRYKGQIFDLPHGYRVRIDSDCRTGICELNCSPSVCYDNQKIAILEKVEDQNSAHSYTEGAEVPKEGMEWIECSSKLPEIGQEVIVFTADRTVTALCRYIRYEEAKEFYWDNNYGGSNWYHQNAITHWMPLPEPPKE